MTDSQTPAPFFPPAVELIVLLQQNTILLIRLRKTVTAQEL